MKPNTLFAAAMVLFIPSLAFAGSKNSASLTLDRAVTVADTQLAPGQYKLTWEGSGPDVTVSFAEGKKTVATTSAKVVNNPTGQKAIEITTSTNNTTMLQAVDLKNLTLQFENTATSSGN